MLTSTIQRGLGILISQIVIVTLHHSIKILQVVWIIICDFFREGHLKVKTEYSRFTVKIIWAVDNEDNEWSCGQHPVPGLWERGEERV